MTKILYAIQGTGNGHLSRAQHIIPILNKKNVHLDILISGIQSDLHLEYPVKFRKNGMSFIFGKKGGVDVLQTLLKMRPLRLYKDIKNIPVQDYDLVISDFEPISSWSARIRKIPCVSLSHQAAIILPESPRPPGGNIFAKLILKLYAPSNYKFGFHFDKYQTNIFCPVIRDKIRRQPVRELDHFTVYLPSYSNNFLAAIFSRFNEEKWQIFSKNQETPCQMGNIDFLPINDRQFVESMASSKGVISGAGFETPSEAIFLGKKLLVVPMKNQYEQKCNALALKNLGITVLDSLNTGSIHDLQKWVSVGSRVQLNYPDETEEAIDQLLQIVS